MAKKREPFVLGPLVLVEWLDAYSSMSGWKGSKAVKKQKPVLVRTVGWLHVDEPDYVTIVSSHVTADDDLDGDVTIVRGMVKSITPLEQPKS